MIKKKKDLVKWCKQTGNCCWFCPNYLTQRKILIRASTPTLSGICLKFCALKTDYLKWLYLKTTKKTMLSEASLLWILYISDYKAVSYWVKKHQFWMNLEFWYLKCFICTFVCIFLLFFFLLTLISVIVSPIL